MLRSFALLVMLLVVGGNVAAQERPEVRAGENKPDEWRVRKVEKIAFVALAVGAHLSVERDLRSTQRARLALIEAGRTPFESNPFARSSFDNPSELRLKAHAATAAVNGVSLLMMRSKKFRGAWPYMQVAIIITTNVAANRNNRLARRHEGAR